MCVYCSCVIIVAATPRTRFSNSALIARIAQLPEGLDMRNSVISLSEGLP